MMTLKQFQSTCRWCDDLSTLDCWQWDGRGFVYLNCLVIERATDENAAKYNGRFYLLIDRRDYFGDLASLEAILYAWAIDEGYSL